ncbi:MAG: Hpt domain-containing protein [Campylobacterota bacterium]
MTIEALAKELDFEVEEIGMLMEVFLETARENVQKLNSAVTEKDYETMYSAAHAIKGSASNLLLNDVVKDALYIEKSAREKEDIDYQASIDAIAKALDEIDTKM